MTGIIDNFIICKDISLTNNQQENENVKLDIQSMEDKKIIFHSKNSNNIVEYEKLDERRKSLSDPKHLECN